MEFSDELLARINDEPIAVGLEVCKHVRQKVNGATADVNSNLLLEAGMLLDMMSRNKLITTQHDLPAMVGGKPKRPTEFYNYITLVHGELDAIVARDKAIQFQAEIEERLTRAITGSFGYELTDGDLKQMQALVDQLRTLIIDSEELDDGHRTRILKRLEKVQGELHKKLSTLDSVYCLAIEASIVAGKIGKNAEPLVKVAKAISGIAWRTHAHTEGLPSSAAPQLLGDESNSNLID